MKATEKTDSKSDINADIKTDQKQTKKATEKSNENSTEKGNKKAGSKAGNIIGTVFAAILSILLFASLVFTSLFCGISDFSRPETLVDIATNINGEKLLVSNQMVARAVEESGLNPDAVDKLLKTKAVKELLSVYSNSVISSVENKEPAEKLTPERVNKIARENVGELADVVKETVPAARKLSEGRLREIILMTVDKYSSEIVSVLPSPESLGEVASEYGGTAAFDAELRIRFIIGFVIVCVIIAALIYLCRFRRFKGFLWIGITSGASAVVTALFAVVFGGEKLVGRIMDSIPSGSVFTTPIMSHISNTLYCCTLILLGCSVLFIGLFILTYKLTKKRRVHASALPDDMASTNADAGTDAIAEAGTSTKSDTPAGTEPKNEGETLGDTDTASDTDTDTDTGSDADVNTDTDAD